MTVYKKYAKFNGEYGFDEPSIIVPPNVTDTYDHDDDEDEEEIVCDPQVDYECDGDMLDNYDGWYYDEESFDVFKLKELIQNVKDEFAGMIGDVEKYRDTLTKESDIVYVDEILNIIDSDIRNLETYMNSPMIYSNDIDVHVNLTALSKMGTIPEIIILKKLIAPENK